MITYLSSGDKERTVLRHFETAQDIFAQQICPRSFPTSGCRLPLWNPLEGEQIEALTLFGGGATIHTWYLPSVMTIEM